MKIISYVVLILTALIGVTFAGLNANSVMINYYLGTSEMPLSLLLVLAVGIGLGIGMLFSGVLYVKLKREIFRLRSNVKLVKKELDNLRVMPLKESH